MEAKQSKKRGQITGKGSEAKCYRADRLCGCAPRHQPKVRWKVTLLMKLQRSAIDSLGTCSFMDRQMDPAHPQTIIFHSLTHDDVRAACACAFVWSGWALSPLSHSLTPGWPTKCASASLPLPIDELLIFRQSDMMMAKNQTYLLAGYQSLKENESMQTERMGVGLCPSHFAVQMKSYSLQARAVSLYQTGIP